MDKVYVPPVSVDSISVTPRTATLLFEESRQFSAQVLPSNATDRSVAWSSTDPSVATVEAGTGWVRGVGAGNTVITARARDGSNVAGSATVTVSGASFIPVTDISIAPSTATLTIGGGQQFSVAVSPPNATNKSVTWSSDNFSAVTVNPTGWVTGVGTGTAVITARAQDGSGFSDSATVVVTGNFVPVTSVSVLPRTMTLRLGRQRQFVASVYPIDASDRAVSWSSGNPLVAEVDAATGWVRGVSAGNTVITATTRASGFSATASLSVTSTSEPPMPPTEKDTIMAEISGPADSEHYSIEIATQEGDSIPKGTTFYIWLLPANRGGTTAQAETDLIGPFVAAVSEASRLNFDLDALETWNGSSIKIPAGKYTLLFADADKGGEYIGKLTEPIEVKESSGPSPSEGGGSGGGGCDAGWGLAALIGVLLFQGRGPWTRNGRGGGKKPCRPLGGA
jgi:uncharacterized protein YjdB